MSRRVSSARSTGELVNSVPIPLEHASVNANDADPSELIISLPLLAYTSATLPDATFLHCRVSGLMRCLQDGL